ncbi:leucine-rich repeat extensin-like protein 5 [Rosa chinensis]|uniref:leucine-rich repeat extensin-like protein 5 n=1 Tax=Rosa chinensis TaxID=74649 RepID=UPI001AD8F62C|nr:leucine-rich repeat extensin-like protein 5 [Rosa chinensis]
MRAMDSRVLVLMSMLVLALAKEYPYGLEYPVFDDEFQNNVNNQFQFNYDIPTTPFPKSPPPSPLIISPLASSPSPMTSPPIPSSSPSPIISPSASSPSPMTSPPIPSSSPSPSASQQNSCRRPKLRSGIMQCSKKCVNACSPSKSILPPLVAPPMLYPSCLTGCVSHCTRATQLPETPLVPTSEVVDGCTRYCATSIVAKFIAAKPDERPHRVNVQDDVPKCFEICFYKKMYN